MTFDELWTRVQGLSDTAKLQVPGVLSAATKKKLAKMTSEDVSKVVLAAIEEVNRGSVTPLDELIKKKL